MLGGRVAYPRLSDRKAILVTSIRRAEKRTIRVSEPGTVFEGAGCRLDTNNAQAIAMCFGLMVGLREYDVTPIVRH